MAPRWSNPSGLIGVERFRVWPKGEDKYNHIDLARNWDTVDAMIGVDPSGAQWPPTTGVGGGIYKVLTDLQLNALPVGMMLAWHRPSNAIPLPLGFEICDGRTLGPTQHNFQGGGNIVLPDMRNRFVIGADPTKPIGQSGVAANHPDVNNPSGAPGPQGTGGSNIVTLVANNLPAHNHGNSGWTGWSPLELVWHNDNETVGHPKSGNFEKVTIPGSGQPCHGAGGWVDGQHRHKLESLSSEGSNQAHENRPAYVGLIWIVKVRKS